MDVNASFHLKLNKYQLACFGLRPYQSKWSRRCAYTIFVIWTTLGLIPMGGGLTEDFAKDINVFMETLICFAIFVGSFAQCTTMYAFNENWMRELDDRITDDWNTIKDPKELAILRKFLKQSKLMNFVYFGTTIAAYSWFVILTYWPLMYDENLASDYSKIFPYYANSWIINNDLRNLQLIVHLSLGVVYFVLFYSMMTSVYVSSVKHACAMYDIVGYRLKRLIKDNDNKDDRIISELIGIVIVHNKAIRCTHLIGQIFNKAFYSVQIVLLAALALIIFDVIFNIRSARALVRTIFVAIVVVEFIFYVNYGGEQVIQYSNNILKTTCHIYWNSMSIRARKILLTIMCRSNKSDQFKLGGMTMSLDNFTMMVKISWSLGAALLSMHRKK